MITNYRGIWKFHNGEFPVDEDGWFKSDSNPTDTSYSHNMDGEVKKYFVKIKGFYNNEVVMMDNVDRLIV